MTTTMQNEPIMRQQEDETKVKGRGHMRTYLGSDIGDGSGGDSSHAVNAGIPCTRSLGLFLDRTGGGENMFVCLY